jgi:hypothetical protein
MPCKHAAVTKHEPVSSDDNRRAECVALDYQEMKTKTKNAKLEIVRDAASIDALLTRNDRGYLNANAKLADVPTADLVTYAVTKLEAGQSALRDAVLFAGAVFKTCTEEKAKLFADGLTVTFGGMSKDILSIGRALPQFEARGLSLSNVRDLYGLRDIRKLALGEDKAVADKAIALLNAGKPARVARKEIMDAQAPAVSIIGAESKAKQAAPQPEPANPEEKAEVIRRLFTGYAEKVQELFDHDERVKIAQQAVAKLKLAGWSLQKVK